MEPITQHLTRASGSRRESPIAHALLLLALLVSLTSEALVGFGCSGGGGVLVVAQEAGNDDVMNSRSDSSVGNDATIPCNSTNCPAGCCDANGVCQSAETSATCGLSGTACQPCPMGTECLYGQCQCTAQSCTAGCCTGFAALGRDGAGPLGQTCQLGNADTECGSGGQGCRDCTLTNGGASDAQAGGICVNAACVFPPPCHCTNGCCDSRGVCRPGASNDACGLSGNLCEDCSVSGAQCIGQECMVGTDGAVCNAQTCPSGCCDSSGLCQQGLTGVVCGGSGTNCQNCLAIRETCANQQCIAGPDSGPSCNADSCKTGCCDALGNCLGGLDAAHCGTGGRRCVDCTTTGNRCASGVCTTPDGGARCSQVCTGCCDASGVCQPGFTDTQCGDVGSACLDCTSLVPASTCDVNVSPRTCISLQTECPGAYPGCAPELQEGAPETQKVCPMADLRNAGSACASGPTAAGCNAFFNFEGKSNVPCVNCLQQFSYEFSDEIGIRLCAQPFVDAACNHNSACLLDCVREACYECPDTPSTVLCGMQVLSGPCAAYAQDDTCLSGVLAGAGALCNPATYRQSFGAWLEAVGAKYCGM